ncbi:MAG: hypothetical protein HKN92_00070 [Chitinophagales bacterium]|nr:hypothetical protein [Chitinophagales bacterium]
MEKIEDFWNWFVQNEQEIIKSIDEELVDQQVYFKDQLDNLILDFGLFSWEIGQSKSGDWYLTISPNNNADMLKISKEIMDHAPILSSWEFNYCKPAKEWDRQFSVYDSLMNLQAIDASNWRYRVRKDPNGDNDIEIQTIGSVLLDEDAAKKAAETVVINEIGEELRIHSVNKIMVLETSDEKFKNAIDTLKSYFKKREK